MIIAMYESSHGGIEETVRSLGLVVPRPKILFSHKEGTIVTRYRSIGSIHNDIETLFLFQSFVPLCRSPGTLQIIRYGLRVLMESDK